MAFRIEERLAVETPPEEREAIYEAAWESGGLQFRAAFQDMMIDKAANDTAADFVKRKIRSIVKDPKTAAILSDIDHPYAAKRPPIDTDYFETFNRDNVTLVDCARRRRSSGSAGGHLHHARPSIRSTSSSSPPASTRMTGPLLRMDIRGRDGVALKDVWEAGPRNYLGLQVAGFPNLFTITGPGSPSVLCNMPVAIEQHVDWITDCIAHMRANGPGADRGAARRGGQVGGGGQRRRRQDAAAAGEALLVSGRQHSGQAARVHALRRRHGALSGDLRRCRGARLRGLHAVVSRVARGSGCP